MNKKDTKEKIELENVELTRAELSSQFRTDNYSSPGEIDLGEVLGSIWKDKWLILIISAIFAISSVLYALSIPNEFRSSAILAPASQSNTGNLSGLASQFGGLASLAGISLGGGASNDKSVIAMELIKTWGFLENFVKDNSIEVQVYAVKGWNKSKNELILDEEIYDVVNSRWIREFDSSKGESPEPNSWELYKKLRDRISVGKDKKTGLISISVEYYSPHIAKMWVDKIVKAINLHIKMQDKEDASKSIEFLQHQISKTNVTEMKAVFYELIEEQTKILMLAEISEEYVLKTVSPAKVAVEKSKPMRAMICILGTFIGGVLGIMLSFFRYLKRNQSNKN
ncbi:MAG: Wzz/FepE/Etk N-terminal domain-containing protein [Kangiellaceae bacterium]|nr:Wzz/FepE/Etk N-terminal domain-containing protein [Kangiellaceae bacterium]MCW8997685.1 Wzz/FepE/Etk N-terminal domain-containing protein [Kangiellaceae bacterium]MCW9018449.1 Wzz/FepE/Etk N-terminal domain-containing protein [Kangiellaceae bacterium]